MKKKILSICLVAVIAVMAIAGASLAYFTAKDDATNVFTIGSVDIELIESTLHRADWGNGEFSDEEIEKDAEGYQDYLAEQVIMPGVAVNKMPYVKNTGKSDAFVRIRVMIPTALDLDILNSSMYCSSALEEEFTTDVDWADPETKTVDGVEYDVYEFTRNEALSAGEMTYWNVWNTIKMDSDTDKDDINRLMNEGAFTTDKDGNLQFNVLVQADAIQAASFKNATEAFAAFDAE